jgi:hypothetical protein
MAPYSDAGTQTKWAGLMQQETVRPDTLLSPPLDTTTPPDEMITGKPQFVYGVPTIGEPQHHSPTSTTRGPPPLSLLERRLNRAGLDPHISLPDASLPASELNDEVPMSPPTTRALIPRALSPEPEAAVIPEPEPAPEKAATPDLDEALTGALTLPANPVDGTAEHIELNALDQVLSKIAKQQATLRGEFDDDDEPPKAEHVESTADDDGLRLSRKGSAESHKSGATEEYDGVILKSPPSNFGAPLGSL